TTVDQNDRLTSGSTIQNSGTVIVEGTLATAAGVSEVLNNDTAESKVTLRGGRVEGDLRNAGTISGDGVITGTLTNSRTANLGGNIGTAQNSGTLTTNGDLTVGQLNNSGTVNVREGDRLDSANSVANSRNLIVGGTLAAGVSNAVNATTRLAGGRIEGDITNAGLLTGNGNVAGTVENNTGRIVIATGDQLGATIINNRNEVSVSGTLSGRLNNLGGARTTLAGGTIDGTVVNRGDMDGNGRLAGVLVNHANATLGGRLDTVDNRGTLNANGALNATSIENSGTLGVAQGSSLSASGTIRNTNAINVTGALNGAIINAGDGAISVDGGSLTGSLDNQGSGAVKLTDAAVTAGLTNSGSGAMTITKSTVTGDISVTDGTVTVENTTVSGTVTNAAQLNVAGNVEVGGLNNSSAMGISAGTRVISGGVVSNSGTISLAGEIRADVDNNGRLELNGGTVTGALTNATGHVIAGSGTFKGPLTNAGNANIGGTAGAIQNSGTLSTTGDLKTTGLSNSGTIAVRQGTSLTSDSAVQNAGVMNIAGGVTGDVGNSGALNLAGGITGNVTNRGGQAGLAGSIGENLVNLGGNVMSRGNLNIAGGMLNSASATLVLEQQNTATPRAMGTNAPGAITIQQGDIFVVAGGTRNGPGATLNVAGTLTGDVINNGIYNQSGRLNGSFMQGAGNASIGGAVTGNLIFAGGTLNMANGMNIGGTLDLRHNYAIAAATRINATETLIGKDATLALRGGVGGKVTNSGTLAVAGTGARINGELAGNGGTIDLRDRSTGTVLTTQGLSGTSNLQYDISTGDILSADRIVVSGGAVTGDLHLSFDNLSAQTASNVGDRVTLLEVDKSFGNKNDFKYKFDPLSSASERIVYSVNQDGDFGDLQLVSQVNPAIGAMFANVTLVQSLIGSVINRPTSPYVTGLVVDHGEKPCGPGGWGRVTGGNATIEGKTDNRFSVLNNRVSATYYGMQGGLDLVCFDNRFAGWNLSFGVLGGVNIGDSRQPIYAINGTNSQLASDTLASITTSNFQQNYGGFYTTGTNGRWTADLQMRYERTDFELKNRAVAGGGLGLRDSEFSSDGVTVSGSVSYSLPIRDTGWSVTPNLGFAYSKYSTDSLSFDEGFVLEFDDSERKIGFFGVSVGRTVVREAENAALHSFATATYFKDFADNSVSRLSNETLAGFDTQILTSENLKSYSDVSVGASYIKVLNPGRAGRPRQFSTSARIDGRFGSNIDGVGVTGQLRLQF
ncbi:MAG: hypothetical protein Q4G25_07410, partial [Paracoccus sp. (in: a-proteobacteria)]|nr:hypothetical protein [Paracoccus sp. (in: a-proteobacteria)]